MVAEKAKALNKIVDSCIILYELEQLDYKFGLSHYKVFVNNEFIGEVWQWYRKIGIFNIDNFGWRAATKSRRRLYNIGEQTARTQKLAALQLILS